MSTDPRFANLGFAVTMTAEEYWAAQPDAVVAALKGADASSPATGTAAYGLAQKGYTIDVPIMVWQWDPVLTMVLRKTAGYTWVPSLLQPAIQEAPGVTGVTGSVPYNAANPPAGSIRVTVDASDYPAADPAPGPPAPPTLEMVGPKAMSNVTLTPGTTPVDVYSPGAGTVIQPKPNVADGQQVPQRGVMFTALWEHTFMGLTVMYTCAPGSVQA